MATISPPLSIFSIDLNFDLRSPTHLLLSPCSFWAGSLLTAKTGLIIRNSLWGRYHLRKLTDESCSLQGLWGRKEAGVGGWEEKWRWMPWGSCSWSLIKLEVRMTVERHGNRLTVDFWEKIQEKNSGWKGTKDKISEWSVFLLYSLFCHFLLYLFFLLVF